MEQEPAAVQFRVLGEVEVHVAGAPMPIRGARLLTLLAVLLVEANRPVTADQLVERVWGTVRQPARPANALQTQVTLLRRALVPVADVSIEWQAVSGYRLAVDDSTVDVHRFHSLIDQARTADADRSASLLTDALGLWRGSPFAGLESTWLAETRAALGRQRLAAQIQLNDLHLRQGRHVALLPSLTDLADEHPLDEHLAGQLMLALYRSGRASDALDHFHQVRHRLNEELGTDPNAALKQLHQRMLNQDRELDLVGEPAQHDTTAPVPRQLPAAPSAFTGRAAELAALTSAVDSVTDGGPVVISALAGPGGIGKTWLALHWAHQNLHRFPDGQLFVDLLGFSPDKPPLPPATAVRGLLDAFGVAPGRIPADPDAQAGLLRSMVAGKRMVVLLDNAADATQVTPLLPGSASCTVLVTSRRHLTGLVARHGARHLSLDVLTEAESRAMLSGRLGAGRVAAEPAATDELVAYCGGFPLALSIVASRAATNPDLSLATLAAELRDARLDALDTDDPAASLPVVLSWSWRTLTPEQAAVFKLLGVAPGLDIGLAAAASLTGLSEDHARTLLRSLEQASLLRQETANRYRMHDLIRRYAADQAEATNVRAALSRLIDYYLHMAANASDVAYPHGKLPRPHTPAVPFTDTDQALAWLDAERPNLVAVTVYAATHGWPREAIRLAEILYRYLNTCAHHHDGLLVHEHGLRAAAEAQDQAAEAAALNNLGHVHLRWGNYNEALDQHNRALALTRAIGDHAGEAKTRNNLGVLYWRLGRYAEALDQYEHSLALARSAGDRAAEADALDIMGLVHQQQGHCERAYSYHRQALVIHREVGNRTGEANSLDDLGLAYCRAGDYEQAISHHRQALAVYRQIGNRTGEADALDGLGIAHLRFGHQTTAWGFHQQAVAIYRELGNRTGEASAHNGLGATCHATGRFHEAISHHNSALRLAIDVGVRHEQARAISGLGDAHLALGDNATARRQWQEALSLYSELGAPEGDALRAKLDAHSVVWQG
jgi:DNA-binding SARP family transcriptional activator/tetratricopeptide (TPR) repeat protein